MKIFSKPVYGFLSSIPLLTLLAFYALILRVTIALGHLPIPYQADPSSVSMQFHRDIIFTGLILSFSFALPLAILALYSQIKKLNSNKYITRAFTINIACVIAWIILFHLDPGHLWSWFFD